MVLFLKTFFIKHIVIIHKGVLSAKIKSSFILGSTATPFALLFETITNWYIQNFVTIMLIAGAVLSDYLVGTAKHIKCKTFSWKENGIGLLIKLGMIVFGGYLAEALPHFLGGENSFLSIGLITALRLSIFMYPAASCWANMAIITNGKFPPVGLMNKIKSFNQNFNVKEFTDEKQS
jgi:hypothetical protein